MGTVTFLTFVEAVAAVKIPGIERDYGMEPPASLNTASLPAKFLRIPRTSRQRFAFCVQGAHARGQAEMTVEVIVAFMPVAQGMPEHNFTQTVTLVNDITQAYLQAEDVGSDWPTISVRIANFALGEEMYWAAVAEVSAPG